VSSVGIVQRQNISAGLQEVFGADVSTAAFAKFCLNCPSSEQFSTLDMLYSCSVNVMILFMRILLISF
jgi:hypothetical protein